MFWSRNSQAARISTLEAKVLELETAWREVRKQFRSLQEEVAEDADRAFRERRSAAARARRDAGGAANQGPGAPQGASVTPLAPVRNLTGARARRLARLTRPDPATEVEERAEGNGDGVSS